MYVRSPHPPLGLLLLSVRSPEPLREGSITQSLGEVLRLQQEKETVWKLALAIAGKRLLEVCVSSIKGRTSFLQFSSLLSILRTVFLIIEVSIIHLQDEVDRIPLPCDPGKSLAICSFCSRSGDSDIGPVLEF